MPRVRSTYLRHLAPLLVGITGLGCGASAPTHGGDAAPWTSHEGRPRRAESLVRAADRFARQGDSIRAEQYLLAALEEGAPEAEIVPQLVVLCVEASRLRAAVEYAEDYLRSHPGDVSLRFLMATALVALARPDAARVALEEVLRLRPDHASAHYVLGSLLLDSLLLDSLGRPERAEFHLRRYLELAPDGAHAAELRAWLQSRHAPRADELPNDPLPPALHAPLDEAL